MGKRIVIALGGNALGNNLPSQIYLIIQTVIIFCMAAESGITRSLTAAHERRRAKRAAEERLKEELKHG